MNVLSLFDGMSCGRYSLQMAGHQVDQYFAAEIDKHATKVTAKNWPNNVHLGDVTKVSYKNRTLYVDGQVIWVGVLHMVLAGSPCQGFSRAGKGLNFEDPRSKLFFEFVRILNEIKAENPDVVFLLENVEMVQEWQDVISKFVGVNPVKINSTLVSAQNRVRLYWTNINAQSDMFGHMIPGIPQPKDRGIVLKDILEQEVDEKFYLSEKAMERIKRKIYSNPRVNPDKTGTLNTKNNSGELSIDSGTTLITDNAAGRDVISVTQIKYHRSGHDGCSHDNKIVVHSGFSRTGGKKQGGTGHLSREDGKTYALNTIANVNQIELIPGIINHGEFSERVDKSMNLDANYHKGPDNHGQRTMVEVIQRGRGNNEGGSHTLFDFKTRIRRLTPIECERLQGLPDNYTFGVSDTQRYRMLGNGWQCDTIIHILSFF
jgi:DNA-cytosine methyltransferase